MHPQMFEFVLIKDNGVTGNMEVKICKKSGGEPSGNHAKVHSKKNDGQGYPHNDWEAFHTRLEKALNTV